MQKSIFTHKDGNNFSTKVCSHSEITLINNLICTQMLTYIHTIQVGVFFIQWEWGVEFRRFKKRSRRYCLKRYPVACQGNSCGLKLALACVSHSTARFTSCFWLRVCYFTTSVCENKLQTFSLLLVPFGQVTQCLRGSLIREGGAPRVLKFLRSGSESFWLSER